MRNTDEIENRLRYLLCEELDRRVSEASLRLPHLCAHNHRQPLDTRKTIAGEPNEDFNRTTDKRGLPLLHTIGLCMLGSERPEDWQGNICEDPIDALRCPYFDPARRKADIWQEFARQLSSIEWLRENMPEAHALYWVLGVEQTTVALPWWKRLWFWVLRIHVEPQLPPFDPDKLLPPP